MPRFIALLAYDSPFFGLHQTLLHSTVERHATTVGETVGAAAAVASLLPITSMLNTNNAASQGEQSRNVKQATPVNEAGGWSWKTGLALAATATLAAGGAWLAKEKIKEGAEWVYDHFQFASELFDEEECQRRMERIEKGGYLFHCFYTIVVVSLSGLMMQGELSGVDSTNGEANIYQITSTGSHQSIFTSS